MAAVVEKLVACCLIFERPEQRSGCLLNNSVATDAQGEYLRNVLKRGGMPHLPFDSDPEIAGQEEEEATISSDGVLLDLAWIQMERGG